MKIRPFRPKDKDQIISLMREFGDYLEKLDAMGRTQFTKDGSLYFTDKLLSEVRNKNGQIFVAEEHGKIIGFIGGIIARQTEEELMEAKPAIPGVINEFFVTSQSRRLGIGLKLMKKIEEYFKQRGFTLVRLDVFAPNQIARNFYQKHGYQDRSVVISKDI